MNCVFALANGFSKIIVENDAISVVSCIKNNVDLLMWVSIVVEVLELLNSVDDSSCQFVLRLENKLAHTLALGVIWSGWSRFPIFYLHM